MECIRAWVICLTGNILGPYPRVLTLPHSPPLAEILLFVLEDPMIESKLEKALKPIPIPYDEFERLPKACRGVL